MPKKSSKNKIILSGNPEDLKKQINNLTINNTLEKNNEKNFLTNLERLENEFKEVSQEIIEEIYEENTRSYILTKKKLEEIFGYQEKIKKKNFLQEDKKVIKIEQKEIQKDLDTNHTDETDKFSSNTDSNSKCRDYSNELSRQVSASNSCNSANNSNINNQNVNLNLPSRNLLNSNKFTNNLNNYENYYMTDFNNEEIKLNNDKILLKKNKKNKRACDISELINENKNFNNESNNQNIIAFKFEDNFISSDEEKGNKKKNNQNRKNQEALNINNKNNLVTNGKVPSLLNQFEYYQNTSKNFKADELITNYLTGQKKSSNEYISVFNSDLLKENKNTAPTPIIDFDPEINIYYFEELLLDYYIITIKEFFPQFSSTEIMEKICEFDFDIDALILSLLDTDKETVFGELNKLENNELSIELNNEIFENFYFEENVDYECLIEHNLQTEIEKEIKKNNCSQSVSNKLNVNQLPELKGTNKNLIKEDDPEEYFLNKPISRIENKQIREDLIKLSNELGFVEEFNLKWVYYQFMDYTKTYNHFAKIFNFNQKNSKLSKILQDSQNPNNQKYQKAINNKIDIFSEKSNNSGSSGSNNSKKFLSTSENSNSNDTSFTNNLFKIINEKPQNWKVDSSIRLNLHEYQEIRRKLIYQAQNAWRTGRHQDAKIIMAKARRYKEEINLLLQNKKMEIFIRNNENNGLLNMISKRENFIDLHGLNFEEAKILTNKKINDIRKKKNCGVIDEDRHFTLTIITGVGNHSQGNQPVLLPKLANFVKSQNYNNKIDYNQGIIKIFI